MYFKKEGVITTLSGKPLKLIGQFAYIGSNISLTEKCEINIHLAKVWIDHMEIWSFGWNKTGFLPSCGCVSTTVWLYHRDANETHREKARQECYGLFGTNNVKDWSWRVRAYNTYIPGAYKVLLHALGKACIQVLLTTQLEDCPVSCVILWLYDSQYIMKKIETSHDTMCE